MYEQAIETGAKHVLKQIAKEDIVKDFYLAGGTALALQLGHRVSVDLDWFSEKNFSSSKVLLGLKSFGSVTVVGEEDGTLHVNLDGVKMSFLRYPYALLYPLVAFNGARLADSRDIACMKLDAVFSRGSKKDFIDLYFLLKQYSLKELLENFKKKYSDFEYSSAHLIKSLEYFEDAQSEPMPKMLEDVLWEEVKESIEVKVRGLVDETPGAENI